MDLHLPGPPFVTFHASREPTLAPQAEALRRLAASWVNEGLAPGKGNVAAVRHLDRALLTAEGSDLTDLTREALLELLDYDPARAVCLVRGPGTPPLQTPVHALLLRLRPELGATLEIPPLAAPPPLPATERAAPPGTLELAKQVLAAARHGPVLQIQGAGVLLTARDLNELDERLRALHARP